MGQKNMELELYNNIWIDSKITDRFYNFDKNY